MRTFLFAAVLAIASTGMSPNPVRVNLADLRRDAVASLGQILPGFTPIDAEFLFQDGYSDLNSEHPFDHAAVLFVSRAPLPHPRGTDLRIARTYGLNGLAEFHIVDLNSLSTGSLVRYSSSDLLATFKAGTNPGEIRNLERALKNLSPRLKTQSLDQIGVLTVSVPLIPIFSQAYRLLAASPIVASTELSAEVYKIPYDFSLTRKLGNGVVVPDSFRTLTADLRRRGVVFQSRSSFPKPFGPGWIDWDGPK